jgi:hypothetical protein
MTVEVIMVIMKNLFSTNRGVALVLLIVAITITALIGAGISSFMASKKASEDLPTYSYKASMLAQSGVEFAVRYAHDNWIDFNINPVSFINNESPGTCTTATAKPVYDSSTPANVMSYLCYDSTLGSLTYGQLTTIGVAGAAQKKIIIRNFRKYADPNHSG